MIPTAEEFINKELDKLIPGQSSLDGLVPEDIKNIAIKFAKLHVKQALEEATEKAVIITCDIDGGDTCDIDTQSILNAYPLTNIK